MSRARARLVNPWTPYVFLAPFVLTFAVFTVYPLGKAVLLSLQQTFGPGFTEFVGAANFASLFRDPLFWKAVRNTTVYTAASLLIQLPISLALAVLLNQAWVRGRAFFRLVMFSPALVGVVFVAMMFGLIFQKRTGIFNMILNALVGFDPDFPWLQEYVMPALIICSLWMSVGFNMIYFLAALQAIDLDLLDAAKVDGAGPWPRFVHITIPAIRPVAGFVVLISMIGSFQLFELPYLLLNNTAGPDYQGLTVVMYLFQNGFETGDLGYASAIGWVLAALLVIFTVIQRWYIGGREQF